MGEQNGNAPKQKYRGPWLMLAAVLLAIGLAIGWMSIAVKKVEQQRDFTPLPAGAPADSK